MLTRHEQGAAFMLYGYARAYRASGGGHGDRKGRVSRIWPPPSAPRIAGCAGDQQSAAWQESAMRERDATQDMDQVTFMRPITKWAYSIPMFKKCRSRCARRFAWR